MLNDKFYHYLELCKPRVVALMLLTAIIGMFLASPGYVPFSLIFFTTLGIALSSSAAAVINHVVDQRIDGLMQRTQHRPLPSGHISSMRAILFALSLGVIGELILIIFVNPLTAGLTFLTLIGYAGIYTLFLKRTTPQNIVIGGTAGASPPLLGWVAVTHHLDPQALLLMLIIFVWTPPHFWALAIHRCKEYALAGVPMLPVTHGIPFTKLCIVLYTLLLLVVSLLPYAISMSGVFYLFSALILGMMFLYYSIMLLVSNNPQRAMKTFKYSIVYLALLFTALLIDHKIMLNQVKPEAVHTQLSQARLLKPFELRDDQGHAFTLNQFKDHWTFLFFGFTRCPMLCPMTLTTLNQMYLELEKNHQHPMPQVVFISVDPEHDGLTKVGQYARGFNPHFKGVTGKKSQIDQLARQLSVMYMKVKPSKKSRDFMIDHSGTILLIDPQARLNSIFSLPHDANQIARDFERISR